MQYNNSIKEQWNWESQVSLEETEEFLAEQKVSKLPAGALGQLRMKQPFFN